MIGQLDQLAVQEESMDSDIRQTQDTIMDLRRRLHNARMSTIAASAAIQNHEAEPATSSLTPSTADEMLRADPVTVDTQALDDPEHHRPLAAVPDGAGSCSRQRRHVPEYFDKNILQFADDLCILTETYQEHWDVLAALFKGLNDLPQRFLHNNLPASKAAKFFFLRFSAFVARAFPAPPRPT